MSVDYQPSSSSLESNDELIEVDPLQMSGSDFSEHEQEHDIEAHEVIGNASPQGLDNGLEGDNEIQAPAMPPHVNNQNHVIVEGFRRFSSTSNYCFFQGCMERHHLNRISIHLRTSVLEKQSIYIPRGARACREHLMSDIWLEDDITLYCRRIHDNLTPVHLRDMLRLLQRARSLYLNLEDLNSIDDAVFHFYTGYDKNVFQDILQNTPTLRAMRKSKRALGALLSKLHTGDSNERLSGIFRVSATQFGRILKAVRVRLNREFVPTHLGFDHLHNIEGYREELAGRILTIPNTLYGNPEAPVAQRKIISICDGTYVYIQKSSNYGFQKKSYSLHKYRNLLKFFLIVCPDGYIIDAFGPFEANKSDAIIMDELIAENPFRDFYHEGDVFILDKGFRNVMGNLRDAGYEAHMPLTKNRNEQQLSTHDANESRKVTLCRYVVENINGRIKNQFRQLRYTYFNVASRFLSHDFKIACALIYAYGARYRDHRLVNEIINEINAKQDTPNLLRAFVQENRLNYRRGQFRRMDANIVGGFPILTKDELIVMACGTYQLAQARSYYGEHIKQNGAYHIEMCEERALQPLNNYGIIAGQPWLLRARIHSRFSNRTYFTYIMVDDTLQGRNQIIGHYCYCMAGSRTLGCCSHVMCVVWYMAWARHQEVLPLPPAAFLDTIIRHDIENEANNEF